METRGIGNWGRLGVEEDRARGMKHSEAGYYMHAQRLVKCGRGGTLVMGVLNVTPDSFYAPSRIAGVAEAVERAKRAMADGADLLDVGGESSRPGARPVDLDDEIARVIPVIEALTAAGCRTSVDTYRSETARRAIAAGASMVNDITGLRGDPEMAELVAETGVDCVIMHMLGDPQTMQHDPYYQDLIGEIKAFFEERIRFAERSGIDPGTIWLDPGFGFGKSVQHNLELLRRLEEFTELGFPLLVGTSNKSTIGAVLDLPAEDRLEGTAATVALAIRNGAAMVRVHEVKPMARVVRMTDAILGKGARG